VSATGQSTRSLRFELVVIVASLGGLEAISTVLAGLPGSFAVPLLVVQHGRRTQDRDRQSWLLLGRRTTLPVRTAQQGLWVGAPGVTVIPGGSTATLDEAHRLHLTDADGLGGGDTLLSSAAAAAGSAVIGIVLTGMLRDGTEGVRAIKRHGGRVLAQDPATARARGMPSSAIATGCVDVVLPLHRIAPALVALIMAPGGADLFSVPTPPWARLHA
jgi:two-component system, chemotaxis family, protein-glutamate methylesterase/glutaminase